MYFLPNVWPPLSLEPGTRNKPNIIRDSFGGALRIDPRLRTNLHSANPKFSLFKYGEKEWVKKFFATGSVRIGSLFEYHKIENGKPGQADYLEGINVANVNGVITPTLALNQWIFCTSKVRNDWLQEKLGGHGYEIIDVRFFLALSRELKKQVSFELKDVLVAQVTYKNRQKFYGGMLPGEFSGLIKRTKYHRQTEARALWEFKVPQEPNINYDSQQPIRERVNSAIHDYISRQFKLCSAKCVNIRLEEVNEYCRPL